MSSSARNERHLDPADVPEAIELAALDVSFISVTLLLPASKAFKGSIEVR